MNKIIGNTVGMGLPKPNLKQTDPRKGDFVKGKDEIPTKVSQLENDSGFLTSAPVTSVNGMTGDVTIEGGAGTFYITVTGNEEDGYTLDKSGEEILNAHNAKQTMMCSVEGSPYIMPVTKVYDYVVADKVRGIKFNFCTIDNPNVVKIALYVNYSGNTARVESFSKTTLPAKATLLTLTEVDSYEDEYGVYFTVTSDIPSDVAAALFGFGQPCYAVIDGIVMTLTSISDGVAGFSARVEDISVDAYISGTDGEVIVKPVPGGVSEEAVNAIIAAEKNSVIAYGAKGDGSADDTAAFQSALAAHRTVTVPGGLYILDDTLVIRENCGLELSQDTILQFTQTSGNCIEMRGSAVLRGNHGNISVPYGFTGNAISMDTALDGVPHNSIPPYGKSCPMWKRQRFIYDVNIVMTNPEGFHRMQHSTTAKCTGTGLYMSAEGTASIGWMWAIVVSGLRVAGGFSYGIRAVNFDDPNDSEEDDAWNHDMRIEAVIEGCEVGASLENCNNAHLDITVQPNTTVPPDGSGETGIPYAKWGIRLEDAKYTDLARACVWDWNGKNSLWAAGNQYQHIAMYGNCKGLVLGDFVYHATSADIRSLIYTDTPSNLERMTILQEPITRWFKPINGVPHFFDGTDNRKLMLSTEKFSAEQAEFIRSADGYYTHEEDFTNLVNGYQDGYYLTTNGVTAKAGYVTTDFIPLDGGDTHTYRIGGEGITWRKDDDYVRIAWYNADKTQKGDVMAAPNIEKHQNDTPVSYYPKWVEDETVAAAFATHTNVVAPKGAAYFRITARGTGANLAVTLDEKQESIAIWHGEPKRLDASIYAQSTFLRSPNGTGYRLIVNDDGTLATEPME